MCLIWLLRLSREFCMKFRRREVIIFRRSDLWKVVFAKERLKRVARITFASDHIGTWANNVPYTHFCSIHKVIKYDLLDVIFSSLFAYVPFLRLFLPFLKVSSVVNVHFGFLWPLVMFLQHFKLMFVRLSRRKLSSLQVNGGVCGWRVEFIQLQSVTHLVSGRC